MAAIAIPGSPPDLAEVSVPFSLDGRQEERGCGAEEGGGGRQYCALVYCVWHGGIINVPALCG